MGLPDSREPCEAEIALQLVAEEEFRMLPPGVDSLLVARGGRGHGARACELWGAGGEVPLQAAIKPGHRSCTYRKLDPSARKRASPPDDSHGLRKGLVLSEPRCLRHKRTCSFLPPTLDLGGSSRR